MDHKSLNSDLIIELFGPEYLELDSEYMSDAALQRIQIEPTQRTDPKEHMKAQARFQREAEAKMTKYSLEPTFQMPNTIRARPVDQTITDMTR